MTAVRGNFCVEPGAIVLATRDAPMGAGLGRAVEPRSPPAGWVPARIARIRRMERNDGREIVRILPVLVTWIAFYSIAIVGSLAATPGESTLVAAVQHRAATTTDEGART
jgi:hypothetical protein